MTAILRSTVKPSITMPSGAKAAAFGGADFLYLGTPIKPAIAATRDFCQHGAVNQPNIWQQNQKH